ncbi:exo-beta-N-acetylmuramidase NamZ family protein [Jiulongibacter sp. NS-SX5]|uniref:exo-beta-N-acetylmuramidase NamZ family protein n=1 Tax=Jiulongibacter sp. NS-SX5 TaxID=3463854 RepID=UPI00405931D3
MACKAKSNSSNSPEKIKVGAERTELYIPKLEGKKVGLVVNHTSQINETHLLDSLISLGINVQKIFAPEHGFRGKADAGEHINNEIDQKTGISIVSLYGKNKKPSNEQLKGLDILVFDIQDVGVRFYTYISTLHYIIGVAAGNDIPLIVLDRPNPNGHYVDGPVREEGFESFVGIDPIPVVYGMTIGELAQMINAEGWASSKKADLSVITCENYDHLTKYSLPIKPSPNLPNDQSILLYPSICFFEPTKISVGRGTDTQFQVIGGPDKNLGLYTFTPVDKPGANNPVNEGIQCYGLNLTEVNAYEQGFDITYLFEFYQKYSDKKGFFTNERFFNLLVGNDWLLKDLKDGKTAEEVKSKWQDDINKFKIKRSKHLLYPDFN